jgi:hypothetical protein
MHCLPFPCHDGITVNVSGRRRQRRHDNVALKNGMLRRDNDTGKAAGYIGWGLGVLAVTYLVVVAALGAFIQ